MGARSSVRDRCDELAELVAVRCEEALREVGAEALRLRALDGGHTSSSSALRWRQPLGAAREAVLTLD